MILFFDTETTGLPKNWKAPVTDLNNWPRMVQLAYLLYDTNGNKISSGDYIIKPNGFTIPFEASQIHGITTEKAISEGVEIKYVLKDFEILVNKATYIVAHNISFDEKIVGAEFLRHKINDTLSAKMKICTMESSTNFCAIDGPRGYKWPNLSELHYKLFKTGFEEAHNASVDITVTAKCFWELKNKGIIIIQASANNNPTDAIKNIETSETQILKDQIEQYCKENDFKDLPLGAKAEAIMFLDFKFKQIDINADIDDEFTFLRDFWAKNETNLLKTTVNSYQNEFLNLTKKRIIEEHKSFSFFGDDKNKSIEDKIMQLEVLSLLNANDTKKYKNLVIHLYYYYLSDYKDFLPVNKKPNDNNKSKNVDYTNIPDGVKKSHESIEKLISDLIIDKTRNGDIPENIFRLVNACNKELIIIKSEIGTGHEIYIDVSTQIVKLSTSYLSEWIKGNSALLTVSIQGMNLGDNFLQVCDKTFNEIKKIEMAENTKSWFNEINTSFDILKQKLQPKSGCYIATMAYGDHNHPQVVHLKQFRDNYLRHTFLGRIFIQVYYSISPKIVFLCKDNRIVVKTTRVCLDFFVNKILGNAKK